LEEEKEKEEEKEGERRKQYIFVNFLLDELLFLSR